MHAEPVFPVGTPVAERDLVGREGAIAELALRLRTGQNLVLFGPRRMGKTTVAEAALASLAKDHLTARLDLTYAPTKQALASALAGACLRAAGTGMQALAQLRAALATLQPELRIRRELGPEAAEVVLSLARGQRRDEDDDDLLREALALPERLATRRGRRFILCLDEFPEVGRLAPDIFRLIRAEIASHTNTTYLFMGSHGAMLAALFSRRNEPLYGFATIWPLPPVAAADWEAHLAARYAECGLQTTPAGIAALVGAAGAHPRDTMLLAQEALILAGTAGTIDAECAATAIASGLRALAPAHEEVWRSLPAAAQAALLAVAADLSPWASGGPRTSKRGVDTLLDRGILLRTARGRYQFVEALFEAWVRSVA